MAQFVGQIKEVIYDSQATMDNIFKCNRFSKKSE